jgi:hypothetical protein
LKKIFANYLVDGSVYRQLMDQDDIEQCGRDELCNVVISILPYLKKAVAQLANDPTKQSLYTDLQQIETSLTTTQNRFIALTQPTDESTQNSTEASLAAATSSQSHATTLSTSSDPHRDTHGNAIFNDNSFSL